MIPGLLEVLSRSCQFLQNENPLILSVFIAFYADSTNTTCFEDLVCDVIAKMYRRACHDVARGLPNKTRDGAECSTTGGVWC